MRARPILGALAPTFLCLVFLMLACFAPVLFRGRQFAYRDSTSFYYPLYLRVQQEWEAGRLPLWMPEENSGKPLLGDPTAAVLYPGKLIFAALPYPWAARVYVIAHVALAFIAMLALLRHWSISPTGATLGASAYAFGAPVLFQYCNVVFLVGAAWMPMGLRSADQWVRLGDLRALGGLAIVLALQTLGGDPEAAYLVAIAAAGYMIGLAISRTSRPKSIPVLVWVAIAIVVYAGLLLLTWISPATAAPAATVGAWVGVAGWAVRGVVRRRSSGIEGSLLGLGAACLLALLLCGAQLVPVVEFIAQSNRAGNLGANDRYVFSLEPVATDRGVLAERDGHGRHGPGVAPGPARVVRRDDAMGPIAVPGRADARTGCGRGGSPRRAVVATLAHGDRGRRFSRRDGRVHQSDLLGEEGPCPRRMARVRRMIATWGIEPTGRFRMATAVFTGSSRRCSLPSVRSDIRPSSSCPPALGSRRWPDWAGTVCRSRIDDDAPWWRASRWRDSVSSSS